MLECFLILYILMLFIFPVPALVVTLGGYTSYLAYKKYLLFRHQPPEGIKVAWLALITGSINFLLSLALGLSLSLLIYFVFSQYTYLFAFNFFFCSLVSVRWFDFCHTLFRWGVHQLKIKSGKNTFSPDPSLDTFVLFLGLKKSTGWGPGLIPNVIDAGYLRNCETHLKFTGVFLEHTFSRKHLESADSVSSDKIKLTPGKHEGSVPFDSCLLIFRDQFYPFKSRHTRNRYLEVLTGPLSPKGKSAISGQMTPATSFRNH